MPPDRLGSQFDLVLTKTSGEWISRARTLTISATPINFV